MKQELHGFLQAPPGGAEVLPDVGPTGQRTNDVLMPLPISSVMWLP